jgi:hypothetical protein
VYINHRWERRETKVIIAKWGYKKKKTDGSGFKYLEAHSAHASHTTHTTGHTAWRTRLLLGCLNNSDLGGTEERGDTAGIDESSADNLEGVEDTGSDHVDVLALGAVESLVKVTLVLIDELANDDRALSTGVLDDLASGVGDGVLDDGNTELLVEVGSLDGAESVGGGLEQTSTTTGQDTLLNSGAGSVQGIDDAVLLLTDLNLGGATDLDDGDTTGELGETLLELLLLVLGGGRVVDDATDLLTALRDLVLAALAVKDDGVLLGNGDRSGRAEHFGGRLLELDVKVVAEDGSVSQNSEIAKNGLPVVTEAGGLDGDDLELTTELVENADGKRLTVNVLGDDDKGTAELLGGLESRDDVLDGGDLLLGEKDQRLLELNLGGLGVGDEVGRDVATVELHALSNLKLVLGGLALLDGDDTLLSDLLHGVGQKLANVFVAVGRDGGDLCNLLAGGDVLLVRPQVFDDGLNSGLGAPPQVHGVAAGGNVFDGLGENGAGEDGGSGGTVTGGLVGLGSDILEQTGTEVLELVLESDGPCDRYTVWTFVSGQR